MISDKKPHIVVGIFGSTVNKWQKKIPLKDGGAAVFVNGELQIAVSEERINRIKHSTGYENAVNFCLDELNLSEKDIDIISLSNCCDYPYYLNGSLSGLLLRNYHKISIVNSHHESHAILAAFQSGFSECIIMVADNEGNLINDLNDKNNYWNNSLERVSFYKFQDEKLTLIESNCTEFNNIGLGDTYHYFTHYLGWHSYTQAGRVMGLSAYGDINRYMQFPLFFLDNNDKIISKIINNRPDKLNSIRKFGKEINPQFPEPRMTNENITQEHMDVAAWIQRELENIISIKINKLVEKTGIRNICLSGGIAYNCLANREVLDRCGLDKIFIPYAPGDEGQPIGNAILYLSKKIKSENIKVGESPFLGRNYSENDIIKAIQSKGLKNFKKIEDIENETAQLLVNQQIVGWFQGKSEMGSRALGNRSVLADPRNKLMKDRLNKLKNREWYRPVAPSVLEEYQRKFFDTDLYVPYMSIAARVLPSAKGLIPTVTHEDNSARIQTVRKSDNEVFYNLIFEFYKMTNIPVLANTSFNLNGEPIVESPENAIDTFIKMNLDYLVMNKFLISR
jgi:carbamoyltransferase